MRADERDKDDEEGSGFSDELQDPRRNPASIRFLWQRVDLFAHELRPIGIAERLGLDLDVSEALSELSYRTPVKAG